LFIRFLPNFYQCIQVQKIYQYADIFIFYSFRREILINFNVFVYAFQSPLFRFMYWLRIIQSDGSKRLKFVIHQKIEFTHKHLMLTLIDICIFVIYFLVLYYCIIVLLYFLVLYYLYYFYLCMP